MAFYHVLFAYNRCITCIISTHCFDENEKFNKGSLKLGSSFTRSTPPHPSRATCSPLHPLTRPSSPVQMLTPSPPDAHPTPTPTPVGCTHLFLISFSKDISLSYPNSPPAGRGMFMMSACVATRTTRSGFFSLPPKAEGESVPFESLISSLAGFSCPKGNVLASCPDPLCR